MAWDMVRWEKWALVCVLALAAGVRLTGLDLGWFMTENARDAMEALRIVEGKNLPLVGPINPKVYALGPLYYYLIAIPFWFSKDPVAAVFFLSLLNLTSVYVTYRLGREFFSPTVGLVGAALYAVFPMAVFSAKALWNPGLIPFFTIIFFYALYQFLIASRPWGLTVAFVALGCLLQVHLGGLALLLILLLCLLIFRPPFPWRHALAGSAIVLALYASYFAFEAQRGFQAIPQAFRFIRQDGQVAAQESQLAVIWKAVQAPFIIPTGMAEGFLAAPPPFFKPVQYLELILFVGGSVWLLLWCFTRWRRMGAFPRPEGLLLLWLAIPLLTLTLKKQGLMWYYFDLLYPSQFLVIGLAVDSLLRAGGQGRAVRPLLRGVAFTSILVIGVVVCAQAWFQKALQHNIVASGALRLPTEIVLRFPDPSWWVRERHLLELMPMKYQRDLTAALLANSSMDKRDFFLNVHGSPFEDMTENRGYFYHVLSRGENGGASDHQLVLREQGWPGEVEGLRKKVGPFVVVEYRTSVQYDSWRYSKWASQGWFTRGIDDSSWVHARMPARNLPDLSVVEWTPPFNWEGSPVYYRGLAEVTGDARDLHLVVSIRDLPHAAYRHRLGAFYLNGQELKPLLTRSYLTIVKRSTEVIFDAGPHLRPGSNLMAFVVTGTSPAFDLDVYEVNWKDKGIKG